MAATRLNPKTVAAYTTTRSQEDVWDTFLPGFGLRVSGTTGKKVYFVRYRVAGGKYRRMSLGRHSDVSLADARAKARAILASADGGDDPAQERTQRRSADQTFAALAEEVLAAKVEATRERTRQERARILKNDLLPAWGTRPAGSITRREVVQLVDAIKRRGAPVMANRTLALIKMLFNEALRRDFPAVSSNPAHLARGPGAEDGRGRFLERAELAALWRALEREGPVSGGVLRLTLLTAQRIGSVRAMRWADIDDSDLWVIPAAAFKGRRRHAVPLSPEARAVLEAVRPTSGQGEFVFPGRNGGSVPHMANHNNVVRRVRERTRLPGWTVHDFRRTFRTFAVRAALPANPKDPAGLGVSPHVADAVLGHKEASLGFDRYTGEPWRYLLAEKRDALERWGKFVAEVVG